MTTHRNRDRLTVLHVATINKPIGTDLGYGPIETIIENVHEGVQHDHPAFEDVDALRPEVLVEDGG